MVCQSAIAPHRNLEEEVCVDNPIAYKVARVMFYALSHELIGCPWVMGGVSGWRGRKRSGVPFKRRLL